MAAEFLIVSYYTKDVGSSRREHSWVVDGPQTGVNPAGLRPAAFLSALSAAGWTYSGQSESSVSWQSRDGVVLEQFFTFTLQR